MKTKTICIAICLLFACQLVVFGSQSTMKDHADSWLKPSATATAGGSGWTDEEDAPDSPTVSPVSDALPVLVLLSGGYLFLLYRRRKTSKIC
jgi:hypothetical protein